MNQDFVVTLFREFLRVSLVLMAPTLIVTIFIGLLVSIFQAATQIHEMTLVIVPKILGIAFCLMVLSPWMLNVIVTYTTNLFSNIPLYVK